MMSQQPERFYEFGPFRLHPVRRLLLRDDEAVPVTSKVFDLLLLLIEHGGQVLPKDEMMKRLWPDIAVEENNLTQQISTLRKVLGERTGENRYVVTVPGRGYSFVANVRESGAEGSDLILEQHTRSLITIDVEEESDEGREGPNPEENAYLLVAAPSTRRFPQKYLIALSLFGILAGLIAVLTYSRFTDTARQAETAARPKSIAVLPFKALSAGPEDAFLGPGMTDTLIAKLSNLHQITVRPTSSVIKYVSSNPDTSAAGRELGVDSVLEGTVQKSGDRVRVTVQLVGVSDGRPLWAESFDERLDDIFAVQDAISEQVARAMLTRLNGEEQQRLRKHHTESVGAYQAYLKGRYFWNKRDEENLRKSVEYFQQAIDIDPSYALAYTGMADAYNVILSYGFDASSREENIRRLKAATSKALEIDQSLAEAHTSLAAIKCSYEADCAGAEKEYRKAIQLNPNYATAHHWFAEHLIMLGRREEAMAEIRRAQELDPLSPIINTTLGEYLYYGGRNDEAIDQFRKTLEIDPNFCQARHLLGLAYEQKGMYAEAIAELKEAKEKSGGAAPMIASLGHAYAVSGKRGEAQRELDELLNLGRSHPYELVVVYVGLGEKQQASEWLRKIPEDKADLMLNTDPRVESLRSDPHFRGSPRS